MKIWKTAKLAQRLAGRSLRSSTKKSFLGYFWIFAPSLVVAVSASLAMRSGVINQPDSTMPYALSVLLGTMVWQQFAEAVNLPNVAFDGARGYITRINFPKSVIIMATLFEYLFALICKAVLAVVLVVIFVPQFAKIALLVIPGSLLASMLVGAAIGCVLLPITLLFVDVHNFMQLCLGYGIFLSTALYNPPHGSILRIVISFNPATPLINFARESIEGLTSESLLIFGCTLVGSIVLVFFSLLLVKKLSPLMIERMLIGGR